MQIRRSLTSLAALAALVGVFFALRYLIPPAPWTIPGHTDDGGTVACTMDAKMCPDGSSVARVPPSCDFALCPAATSTDALSPDIVLVTAMVNQSASAPGVKITPLQVTEDSRCPLEYTCIQMGTVKMRAQVATAAETNIFEFILGVPVIVGQNYVTLTDVSPKRVSNQTIPISAYQLSFKIQKL